MLILKFFAEGLLTVSISLCIIFLVVGNMYMLWFWVKDFEKKGEKGAQYFYLKFWGYPGEYSKEELNELHQKLEQFEEEYKGNY